jgi:DNA polymerase-4
MPLLKMHIDLNSAFATTEQQARPCLRGRPVAVSNRISPNSCIITASYEAKALGVKVGMRRFEALKICPNLVFVEADPPKYIFVYDKLLAILESYSAKVRMKSIDEGVIDFTEAPQAVVERGLEVIGREIKQRLRDEIGCYMRCNVGIGPNFWMAKVAAGLHKPDGLDTLTAKNARSALSHLKLQDLTGIASGLERKLNALGIYTVEQLFDASLATLQFAFKTKVGEQWYKRLHGEEVDDTLHEIKSIGRQYVLEDIHLSREEIKARLLNLAEDVGEKLRSKDLYARGVYVWVRTLDHQFWHRSFLAQETFSSNSYIWQTTKKLFDLAPTNILEIGVSLYKITDQPSAQLSFFYQQLEHESRLFKAVDDCNHRFGNRTVHACASLGSKKVKKKVPFGSTRWLGYR